MTRPVLTTDAARVVERGLSRRDRRRERRRLAEMDLLLARRAELHLLRQLLTDAGELVTAGWVQHCWFTVSDDHDRHRRIGGFDLRAAQGNRVTEVCLVGAVVQAGGGVSAAGTQPVQRALDLTWATLQHQPVRFCPSPPERLAHVRQLTRWNDAAGRTASDVTSLLAAAADRAAAER